MATSIEIPTSFQKELLNVPESGMGFHKVNIILKNKKVLESRIILNCQYLQLDKNETFDIQSIEIINPL